MRFPRALLLLCAVAGPGGCGDRKSAAPAAAPRGPRKVPVAVAPVTTRPVAATVPAVGTVEAYQVVTVPARVEGVLEDVAFEEGNQVQPTTVLAVVDGTRRRLAREQAEAAEGKAQASAERVRAGVASVAAHLAEAREKLANREQLATQKLVTGEELQAARTEVTRLEAEQAEAVAAVKEAEAAVKEVAARVAITKREEEDARIHPPIAGVVEAKRATPGGWVKAGETIATIVDTCCVRIRFRVGERESPRIGKDAKVSFRVAAIPSREFHATILLVGRTADPVTRMVELLAEVTDAEDALKPGFFAEVTVEVAAPEERVVVPEESVLLTEQGFVSFVVENGKARLRTVVPGLKTRDGQLEIASGLRPGESLVVEGASALQEGSDVDVASPAATPTNGPGGSAAGPGATTPAPPLAAPADGPR